jgi:hypothetical protein
MDFPCDWADNRRILQGRDNIVQQLSGQDASFLYFETPTTPMHIGGIMIYDQSSVPGGRQGFKDILRAIESRLHLARSFREKVVNVPFNLDHPWWAPVQTG